MSKTHMTLSDRVKIQTGLEKRESFKKIAEDVGKDCTTVSREVKNHFIIERKGSIGRSFNDCQHKAHCSQRYEECSNEQCEKDSCRY